MPFVQTFTRRGITPVWQGAKRQEIRLYPSQTLAKGTLMCDPGGWGSFQPYTGSETPTCVLEYDCLTDRYGNAWYDKAYGRNYRPLMRVSAFIGGCFECADIPNLDDNAVRLLGRLIEGDITSGLFVIPCA